LQARSCSPRRHRAVGAPCSPWPPGAPSAPRSVPSAAPPGLIRRVGGKPQRAR
jgi:hypothetical protein